MIAESKPGGIGSPFGIGSTYCPGPDGRKGCNMQVDLGTTGTGPGLELEGAAQEIRGSMISLMDFVGIPSWSSPCPLCHTSVSSFLLSPFDSYFSIFVVTFHCRSPRRQSVKSWFEDWKKSART